VNRGVIRFEADVAGIAALKADAEPKAALAVPVMAIHSINDPQVSVNAEAVYRDLAKATGTADKLVQAYTDENEHTAQSDAEIAAALEIFDRLYNDWSTLVKFQRTRGVLRLMAAVIHSRWEKGDRNPLILPANIAIDDPRVQFELTRYLSDNWVPVIAADVDGPNALPLRLDGDIPNLGRFAACRRVARAIYLGSAPTATAANRGVEDRRVRLGCVTPGESVAVFGDALRRLSTAATYLYHDGTRYWYSTQPTVTKMAEDRAEQLTRNPDKIVQELDKRVRADLRKTGDFPRVHPLPQSGQDVPDDMDARLVVLGIDHPYSKESATPLRRQPRRYSRVGVMRRGCSATRLCFWLWTRCASKTSTRRSGGISRGSLSWTNMRPSISIPIR
jgi:hypothetical protein